MNQKKINEHYNDEVKEFGSSIKSTMPDIFVKKLEIEKISNSIKQIKKDYPVISTEGIVGKIITVSQNYAVILPLDHHQFKIGVMLKRNHLQGLLESDILGNTFMTMIPIGSDIELGDTLQTSDISSIFPKGYPVGKVIKLIQSPNKIFMKAEIETFVKPTCLDQVVILHYEKEKNYEREIHRN